MNRDAMTLSALVTRIELWLRRQLAGEEMQRLIKRASSVFLLQIAGALAVFLCGILLARSLGAEDYGRYAFAITLMIVLRILANLGLPMIMMRWVAVYDEAKDWGHLKGLFRFAAKMALRTGVLAAGLAAAAVVLLADKPLTQTSMLVLMALPLLVVLPLTEAAAGAMRGLQHVATGQASEAMRSALFLVLLLAAMLLTSSGLSAGSAILLRIGAETLGLALTLFVLYRLLPSGVAGAQPVSAMPEWRGGQLGFTAVEAAYLIYQQTDILMLSIMRPMAEVGVYRMASNLSFAVVFASVIASATLAPMAASAWSAGRKDELRDSSVRLSRLAFVLTLAVYIALLIAIPVFIDILGKDFAGLTVPLVILGLGNVIRALMSAAPTIVLMTGSERGGARAVAASAVANLVLNAAFIPLFGIIGSAIATAISSVLQSALYVAIAYRSTGITGAVFDSKIAGWLKRTKP